MTSRDTATISSNSIGLSSKLDTYYTVMDSLIAKGDAVQPLSKKRKRTESRNRTTKPSPSSDRTAASVAHKTSLPKSLRPTSPPGQVPKNTHIKDLKLRTQLNRQASHAAQAKELLRDAELLLTNDAGTIRVENDLERTWRVGQDDIAASAGQEAAKGRQEWRLDGGPYRSRYTRNGRSVNTFI